MVLKQFAKKSQRVNTYHFCATTTTHHTQTMKPLLVLSIVACVLGMFQYGYSVTCINQPKHLIEKFIVYAVFQRYSIALTGNNTKNIFIAINGLFNIMGMIGALNGGWLSSR